MREGFYEPVLEKSTCQFQSHYFGQNSWSGFTANETKLCAGEKGEHCLHDLTSAQLSGSL